MGGTSLRLRRFALGLRTRTSPVVSGVGLLSSSLARCMRVQGVVFASKNIGLSQPVPRGQRQVSADQCQVIFPSPRL
jgi:hypothetical protein